MSKKRIDKQTRSQYLVLASLTHDLTGEEESDIFGYLAKFGVSGFFARIDATELPPELKSQLNELQAYLINYEGVMVDVDV
ncbi:MAG: hypothetical protein VB070_15035 [Clostridiaceae bacterium]|nr:hypothetical protein [Clostridiaceae bacterium]